MMKPTLLMIALLAVFSGSECISFDGNASARIVWEKQQNEGLLVIDIRRPEEWLATGVPRGAKILSIEKHPLGLEGFLQDLQALLQQDMSRPFALICRTGNRTSQILPHFRYLGFENAMHVSGGIFGNGTSTGWLEEKLPMSTEVSTISESIVSKSISMSPEVNTTKKKEP